jgi:hypothetical protein
MLETFSTLQIKSQFHRDMKQKYEKALDLSWWVPIPPDPPEPGVG